MTVSICTGLVYMYDVYIEQRQIEKPIHTQKIDTEPEIEQAVQLALTFTGWQNDSNTNKRH